jgi:N-acetylneuraminic acid mutarotase
MVQPGVAGAVIGINNNQLVVAGGANFEDDLPWRGGTKSYHDEVYLLSLNRKGRYTWSQPQVKLPEPVAYSACVSVPDGILSIGGENSNGPVNKVYCLNYIHNKQNVKILPDLPEAITSAGAVVIGDIIYVSGGINKTGAVASCYRIDLSAQNPEWKTLAPMPLALSHGVMAAQSDGSEHCVYVIGGRFRKGEVSTFLNMVFKYTPSLNRWQEAGNIEIQNRGNFGLSAGSGVAYLDKYIVLFGGDQGTVFRRIEQMNNALAMLPAGTEKQALLLEKDKLLSQHPGFGSEILLFNTLSGKWQVTGVFPGTVPVTTTAVWWHNQVYIPSGEVRPGIRTNEVSVIELNEKE